MHTALHFSWLGTPKVIVATEPWTSPSTAWLNKPHTVISEPLSCGIALDTLLYMCLHIAFTYWMVWLWFAAWPASISVCSFCTDQIASLMAWDDDTGRNVFQRCSKTTSSEKTITWSWHQTTCLVKHDFSPLTTQTARAKGVGKVPVVESPFFDVTGCIGFCLSDQFASNFAVLAAGRDVVWGFEIPGRQW